MHFQAASETGMAFAPAALSLALGFVGGIVVTSEVSSDGSAARLGDKDKLSAR